MISVRNVRSFLFTCAMLILIGVSPVKAELTFEMGEQPGEIFFIWQGTITDANSTMGSLKHVSSFITAYEKNLLEKIEILEVRDLDTDQLLDFNYTNASDIRSATVQNVCWYYKNPILAGGRARLLIRGKIYSSKIFNSTTEKVEIKYQSGDELFIIIPLGFCLTYCNSPIIVYEKNSRTVASFKTQDISLTAKKIDPARVTDQNYSISRDALAKPILSTLPLVVEACTSATLLASANKSFNKAIPVIFKSVDETAISKEDLAKLIPGKTMIWSVDGRVISGMDHYLSLIQQLSLFNYHTLQIADYNSNGDVVNAGEVKIMPSPAPVEQAKQP